MLKFTLGFIFGIVFCLVLVGLIFYKYYKKNMKKVTDLKSIFENSVSNFEFKDSDFED